MRVILGVLLPFGVPVPVILLAETGHIFPPKFGLLAIRNEIGVTEMRIRSAPDESWR